MRQRSWTFYKIVLYLGLAFCIGLIGILLYIAFSSFGGYWHKVTVYALISGACLQTVFFLLCFRLVHSFVPNRIKPGRYFNILFTILLIFSSCTAIGSLLLLALGFSETFLTANSRPQAEDYIALAIVGGYTFISIYISAASIVLRRYNRYQVISDEENWLSQLGNLSLNE